MSTLNEGHRIVAKGTFWGLAGNIALKFFSFIYLVLVARFFSQNDVGTFYLALSIIGAFTIFSDLGLGAAFTRYIPFYLGKGQKKDAYSLLQVSYMFSGTLSFLLSVGLFLAAGLLADAFKAPGLDIQMQLLAIFLFLCTLLSLNTSFLSGLKRMKESNLLLNLQNTLKLVLTIALFIFMGANYLALSISFIASYVIAVAFSFWYLQKNLEKEEMDKLAPDTKGRIELLKEIVPFGLMLSIVVTFWTIITYTDRILLGYFLGGEKATIAIAIYTMATTLATMIMIFPSAVSSIFLPMISELYAKEKRKEMAELSNSAIRWVIFLITPPTLIFIIFPEEILQMFYGKAYSGGAVVLMIFAIGFFIRSLSFIQGSLLAALRAVKLEIYTAAAAAVSNIALNWVLIPRYGIEGAAISSAVSFALVTVLLVYFTKKTFGLGFSAALVKPIVAAAIGLLILFLLRGFAVQFINAVPVPELFSQGILNVIVQKLMKLAIIGVLFTFTCAIYFIALLGMKGFASEDKELLSVTLRKARVPSQAVIFAERVMGREEA